jgi:tryptophan synthase beta chain
MGKQWSEEAKMSLKTRAQANLSPDEIPTKWYNILPDLPQPLPPPRGDEQLKKLPELLIGECLKQEFSTDTWIDIPDGTRELYLKAGRPRPLFRATKLEKVLGTPARMYYKSEFFSPTGSHKVNTALAQAYYAKEQGVERLTTETGAGQWGTALSYAASVVGLKCTVFWVRAVHRWKDDRRDLMKMFGAEVFASPSDRTAVGRSLLEKDREHPGSLAIAISEGLEDAHDPKAVYSLGSVLNHVLLHQTVIGQEAKKQFEIMEDYPDIVISCIGGGSNFGGFAIPFMHDVLKEGKKIQFIAAQSQSAPNLQGEYRYDFADHGSLTPELMMYTLGHRTDMDPIKGDGLRYHGCSPILSLLRNLGYIDTVAYPVDEKHVFEGARLFTQMEGFLPAPESAYSITCAIDEARKCKETGESKAIAFNVSGHGFLDMVGYRSVLGL